MSILGLYEEFPIMQKLADEKVCSVELSDPHTAVITEGCDCYFGVDLNKEEVQQISKFFHRLAELM